MSHKTIKKIMYGTHCIKLYQYQVRQSLLHYWGGVVGNVSYRRNGNLWEDETGDHIHTNTHVTPLPLAHAPVEVTPRLGNTLIDIN